jgi:hypothetical protein
VRRSRFTTEEVLGLFAEASDPHWDEQCIEWQARRLTQLRQRHRPSKRKPICPNGHERTEANTYAWRGKRKCRECRRAAKKRHTERVQGGGRA